MVDWRLSITSVGRARVVESEIRERDTGMKVEKRISITDRTEYAMDAC